MTMHDEIAVAVEWWAEKLRHPRPYLGALSEHTITHFKTALRTRIQQALAASPTKHIGLTATMLDPKSPIRLAAHDAGIGDGVLRFPARPYMHVKHDMVVVNEGHGNHMIYPRTPCPASTDGALAPASQPS